MRHFLKNYQPKSVLFDDVVDDNDDRMESKLRRRDTPHYLKGKRLTLDEDEARERVVEILGQDTGITTASAAGIPAIEANEDSETSLRHQVGFCSVMKNVCPLFAVAPCLHIVQRSP